MEQSDRESEIEEEIYEEKRSRDLRLMLDSCLPSTKLPNLKSRQQLTHIQLSSTQDDIIGVNEESLQTINSSERRSIFEEEDSPDEDEE